MTTVMVGDLKCRLVNQQPWEATRKLAVNPGMLFGKRGQSGLVALNLDIAILVHI